ncbi:hypothetical protein scyTo_0002839 [Scyliorhinus torazame]|uniref:Uncharacterized protein n=1 Tax=Scyliorhinus torazame TaxID=75743 RepID=A0A401PKY2_SCYTO|nr:hypothetical protein [Scyliorhinus torazame]
MCVKQGDLNNEMLASPVTEQLKAEVREGEVLIFSKVKGNAIVQLLVELLDTTHQPEAVHEGINPFPEPNSSWKRTLLEIQERERKREREAQELEKEGKRAREGERERGEFQLRKLEMKSVAQRERELDAAWKSNNLRRRVVRETVHGHPYTTKRNIQKKTSTFPPRNFEELFEDLVEVLETDLKQGPSQTVPSISEIDFQVGYCTGCPVSFPASNTGNQELQTHQGNLHHLSSHFSKGDSTFPDLVSINPKPPSHLEPVALNFSPGQLTVFTDEHCGNTSDEECQPCYAQNVTGQSLPCSPSTEADWFSQAELNAIQNGKAPHIESKHLPDTSQQQHSPNDSALSFFQFQLRYVEDYLCTVSMQEILSVDKNGNTMLHNAVIQGKRALAYSLACRTANVGRIDAKDSRGRTALHLAAERNQHLMVSDLISLGAQINGRDYLGKTPVHLCAESGFLRVLHVIEKTLKNGTNVHIDADLNGQSAIDYAEEVNDTEVLNFLSGYFDRMKAAHHEEFIPSGVLDVMDQNAELKELVSGGQLLPCDIFLQTSVGAQ